MTEFLLSNFQHAGLLLIIGSAILFLISYVKKNEAQKFNNLKLKEMLDNTIADLEFKNKMSNDRTKNPNFTIDELVKQLHDKNNTL